MRLAGLLVALTLITPGALAAEVGAPAPAFSLADGQGQPVSLQSLRGKVVYVDFWASWCAPCLKSFPWINDMQRKYGPQGFQVVAVNLDKNRADAERFLTRTPSAGIVAFDPDGTSAKAYTVRAMPSAVLVGRDGVVRLDHQGFRDSDAAKVEAAIRAAVEGK